LNNKEFGESKELVHGDVITIGDRNFIFHECKHSLFPSTIRYR